MNERIFQVDAFASRLFSGNPAAVVVLDHFLPDAILQAIAAENNLAETAFLVAKDGDYDLRWFSPKVEVPLCGHATFASAAVVMERIEPKRQQVVFNTASGLLPVQRTGAGYVMNFPQRPSAPITPSPELVAALCVQPVEVLMNQFNYMAVLANETQVRQLAPDLAAIARMDRPGVIVTATGDGQYDFVSRYFAPAKGIAEDPVTGAAHCMLAPYWSKRLGKMEFNAFQASARGGEVRCRVVKDRVELEGECVFFLEGKIRTPSQT